MVVDKNEGPWIWSPVSSPWTFFMKMGVTDTIFFPIFPEFLEVTCTFSPYHLRISNAQVQIPGLYFCLMGNTCHTALPHVWPPQSHMFASCIASLPFQGYVKQHPSCLFNLHLTWVPYIYTNPCIVYKTLIEHQEDLSLVLLEIFHPTRSYEIPSTVLLPRCVLYSEYRSYQWIYLANGLEQWHSRSLYEREDLVLLGILMWCKGQ